MTIYQTSGLHIPILCIYALNVTCKICSYLNPNASKFNSSNHIERLNTCNILSRVSVESLVCDIFKPRKNVLYSSADTIAIKSLCKPKKIVRKKYTYTGTKLTLVPNDQNPVDSGYGCHVINKLCPHPKLPLLCELKSEHYNLAIESWQP
jgi:hypothetical protein